MNKITEVKINKVLKKLNAKDDTRTLVLGTRDDSNVCWVDVLSGFKWDLPIPINKDSKYHSKDPEQLLKKLLNAV
jgi:hypothetical protein